MLAGLDVQRCGFVARVRRRRPHREFLRVLRSQWPRGRLILVSDSLSIDTTPEVRVWLKRPFGTLHQWAIIMGTEVRPVVSRLMPLSEAARAHQLLYDRAVTGRIVLRV